MLGVRSVARVRGVSAGCAGRARAGRELCPCGTCACGVGPSADRSASTCAAHAGREQTDVRALPLLFLGSLLFIPGFYHVRIAYYAYRGYHGYDFSQIPTFEDDD